MIAREFRWLRICAALAAGEYLAAQVTGFAEAWPFLAILAGLAALFGYGLALRGWPIVFFALLGMTLFLQGSVAHEQDLRLRPWMRGKRQYQRVAEPKGLVGIIRSDLSRRVTIGLGFDRDVAALNRAILLGERSRLPRSTRQAFIESGTMHVFAISGLHVMAIAQVFLILVSLLLLPRRLGGVVAMAGLWGYVWVIGFPPSAMRAATMATFCHLAPVFWRQSNTLRAWELTFLLFHLISPTMIVNVGSALSFTVMLAIVLTVEFTRDLVRWKASLLIAFAAWAAGVPIAAHVFGRVTPGGLLANLVLIPAAGGTVVSGALGVVASFVSEALAVYLNNLSALFTSLMVGVSEIVSHLPGANLEVGRWGVEICVVWYAALILIFPLVRSIRHRDMI